jgi:RNA polymerase sigma factor (sigma-70 family)
MAVMGAATVAATVAATAARAPLRIIARMGETSDEALMLAYAGGDAAAFATLYDRHERPVYRFLLRSAGSADLAADLLQETWLAVVRHAATYEVRARFSTWLYGIARNKLIDHWRARRPEVSLDEPAANEPDLNDPDDTRVEHLEADRTWQPEVRALSQQQARAYLAAVEALPPAQRDAFLLQVEGELTLEEIGELTGVGRETVKSRLRYAQARLREALKEWQKDPA